MDFDQMGQMNIDNFVQKIGAHKAQVVKEKTLAELNKLTNQNLAEAKSIKDANDVLQIDPLLIKHYLETSQGLITQNLIYFKQIRDQIKHQMQNKKKFQGL